MDTTDINMESLHKMADGPSLFTISNGVALWIGFIIMMLVAGNVLLAWLLLKREKTIKLMQFNVSPLGLKLTYELDKDEKMNSLVTENILLQDEVRVLRSALKEKRFKNLIYYIIFLGIFIYMSLLRNKTGKGNVQQALDEDNEPIKKQ